MNRWTTLGLWLILAGALVLRWPQLAERPMHNDEAVNALKVQTLWEKGEYAYNPDEYHGPTLSYFTLPFVWLSGARSFAELTETPLRLVPLVFGLALILALPLLGPAYPRGALLWAAALTALSPAMVFYSRYFIHELILVFFSFVALAACWRYACQPRLGWALLAAAGVGLMYATKETFVLAVAALGLAFVAARAWAEWVCRPTNELCGATASPAGAPAVPTDHAGVLTAGRGLLRRDRGRLRVLGVEFIFRHHFAAALITALVTVVLFSSFFTHWPGVVDAIKTYLPWLKRAGGHSPHLHPWYFYLHRLAWYHVGKGPVFTELLILVLAGIGALAALLGRGLPAAQVPLARLLAFYTLFLTTMYSLISYKTPWCFLGFWHGMILLAGLGVMVLFGWSQARGWRAVLAVLLVAGGVHLGWQSWQATHQYAAGRQNPYVYGHTVPNVLKLAERLEGLAKVSPQGYDTVIQVMAKEGDYWPLPWYLRRFTQVGYWDHVPAESLAPVVLASMDLEANLDARTPKTHLMAGMFQMRPKAVFELYVQTNLWMAYIPTVPRSDDD